MESVTTARTLSLTVRVNARQNIQSKHVHFNSSLRKSKYAVRGLWSCTSSDFTEAHKKPALDLNQKHCPNYSPAPRAVRRLKQLSVQASPVFSVGNGTN